MDRLNAENGLEYQAVVDGLRNSAFLKMPRYQEQQTRAKVAGAHPKIIEFSKKLVKRGAVLGIPLFPHCIVRDYEDQAVAFVKGVTKDSPEDGLWPHRFAAVDIIHGTRAWDLTRQEWAIIGHLGKEVAISMSIKIEWGGDWKFYDPAHFELKDWKSMDPFSFEVTK
ncbi:M15 family metallopeptidase [Agrobacterium larrymoorei]|uniref:M15 family metallopeptidase n=1 Tax=Agrobacterium larrymoorei TaxID=160699 RepID=A0AAF0H5H9_9HYPH|nr:M15 family metallopeptidase [Agrobacterium larrymoorei]WHA39893.1 hypothetical protein CFBP5477_008495 [Agrobacterium larrymoorei]